MTQTMNARSAAAHRAFLAHVEMLGGSVLEGRWLGSTHPHQIVCAAGHESYVRPNNLKNGQGACRSCAGRDPWTTETEFRKVVSAAGACVLGSYKGTHTPVKIRCIEGHIVSPNPRSLLRGTGVCRVCAGSSWDVFYIVIDDAAQVIKFGITSRDGRARLSDHARDGFTRVEMLRTGLPGSVAPDTEREVKRLLAARGARPVRGREYFPLAWLPTVLEVAAGLPR